MNIENKSKFNNKIVSSFSMFIVFLLLILFFQFSHNAQAKPVNKKQAEDVVKGWLKSNPMPFGNRVSGHLRKTEVYTDGDGEAIYFIVYLNEEGFVVVPADNQVEPIIAFVAGDTYDPSLNNPLGALVSRDVQGRLSAVRSFEGTEKIQAQDRKSTKKRLALESTISKASDKWAKLGAYEDSVTATGILAISDVRVSPLIQSKWDQGYLVVFTGEGYEFWPLYNYYTPGPHYGCGCVATAMAQLMRYHQYPTIGVGTPSFTIHVDGSPQTAYLRGGDGSGGPYLWSEMVLQPDDSITDIQRQAIGALCYDAGVSVEMYYTAVASAASLHKISGALSQTFNYSNAISGEGGLLNIGAGLIEMINPNLDANLPVVLGIRNSGTSEAHAVVCDGYGYDNSTLYHHLNMGWAGRNNSDVWYSLPQIETDTREYNTVNSCAYNVFTSGSGEIVSGRITGPGGVPIGNAIVVAKSSNGSTYTTISNDNGIYALVNMASNTAYIIRAYKSGWRFSDKHELTGLSHRGLFSGNLWGIDFNGMVSTGFVEVEKEAYLTPETVTVRVVDEDLAGNGTHTVLMKACNGDIQTLTLTEHPTNLGVFAGDIPTAEGVVVVEDGVIQISGEKILIATYEDSNDGTGNPITRRDTATVTTNQILLYETDFTGGLPVGWTIIDGFADGITWNSDNPGWRSSPHWDGTFMIVDCENPSTIGFDEQLITSNIDCRQYERVTLVFSHDFYEGGGGICTVDVRVDGNDWQSAARYEENDVAGQEVIDLSWAASGKANVQIRWYYYEPFIGEYWGIDDVRISGISSLESVPGDFEPDCDVDWADLSLIVYNWLMDNPEIDIVPANGGDGIVNMLDLALLAESWMVGVD